MVDVDASLHQLCVEHGCIRKTIDLHRQVVIAVVSDRPAGFREESLGLLQAVGVLLFLT